MPKLHKALLLAAGLGTRLGPLTRVFPKCLMPINGKPLLWIWLEMLSNAGFDEIVVNTHYSAELVRDFIHSGPYRDLVRLDQEPELLGTGGTLIKHKARFAGGPLLVAHADNLSLFDPVLLARRHAERPADVVMTMMTFETQEPHLCGILELGPDGRVLQFHEKTSRPVGNLANAAVYVVEPEVARIAASLGGATVDLSTQVIPLILNHIQTFHNFLYHRDIGTPISLARAQLEYPFAMARARLRGFRGPAGAESHDQWSWANGASYDDFLRALSEAFRGR